MKKVESFFAQLSATAEKICSYRCDVCGALIPLKTLTVL